MNKKGFICFGILAGSMLMATVMTGHGNASSAEMKYKMQDTGKAEAIEVSNTGFKTKTELKELSVVYSRTSVDTKKKKHNSKTEKQAVTMKPVNTCLDNNSKEAFEIKKIVTDALEKYFDVTYDASEYDIKINWFEGYNQIEPGYMVDIGVPENMDILKKKENIGSDGFPTKEAKKCLI